MNAMMKPALLKAPALVLILISTACISVTAFAENSTQQPELKAVDYLNKASRVDRIYIAPQPDPTVLKGLAAEGVDTVVNFRRASEMSELAFDQAAILSEQSLAYHQIETGGETHPYSRQQLNQLDAILKSHTSSGALVLHCRSGYRAGVVLAAWLVENDNQTLEQAIERIGDERITAEDVNKVLEQGAAPD